MLILYSTCVSFSVPAACFSTRPLTVKPLFTCFNITQYLHLDTNFYVHDSPAPPPSLPLSCEPTNYSYTYYNPTHASLIHHTYSKILGPMLSAASHHSLCLHRHGFGHSKICICILLFSLHGIVVEGCIRGRDTTNNYL